MNDAEWMVYLDTLPPDHRDLAQYLLSRVQTILNHDRARTLDDMQRVERRTDHQGARLNDLSIRLDTYEVQRANDIKAELERFARDQIAKDEYDRLISVLYNLSTRVEALEAQRADGHASG